MRGPLLPVGLRSAIDSVISLASLARYPSPQAARGLGEKRLAVFLKTYHYTNRKTSAQLLERLRLAPAGRGGEIETRRRRSIVLRLARTLEVIVEQIAELVFLSIEWFVSSPSGDETNLFPGACDDERSPSGPRQLSLTFWTV